MVGRGMAWPGLAGQCAAGRGFWNSYGPGLAWLGAVGLGLARQGEARGRLDTARHGMAGPGLAWQREVG